MTQREIQQFDVADASNFRVQLSAFAARYENFALLDSCGNEVYGASRFDYALAAGAVAVYDSVDESGLADWQDFVKRTGDWCFGFLSYELNATTDFISPPEKKLFNIPALRFFVPEMVVTVKGQQVEIAMHPDVCQHNLKDIFQQIINSQLPPSNSASNRLEPLISAYDYLDAIKHIQQHIIEGDIYELNYCQPYLAENAELDPISLFNRLCAITKAPFSVLHRFGERYLICASPERFFQFDGVRMRSMPIKGTRSRGADAHEDAMLRDALLNSEKDRAEHVMIVDLVRNDLTPYAVPGTINVDELFGLYAFEQVYQMVSTISAELKPDANITDALLRAFPMGSMTGAPKIRAMELAAAYEPYQRGLYSGTFGYFAPDGTCDFNVVIRSLLYHSGSRRLAAYAGGAIVYDSVPEHELEECEVKLRGVRRVLAEQGGE